MSNIVYPDIMCDLETSGLSPDDSAILQIAAVRFNLKDRTVDSDDMFNRCLAIPPKRYWDEGTREFWAKQKPDIIADIYRRMENPAQVMKDFAAWAGYNAPRFWAKPISFDYVFVSSYFKQFELHNPFHYRHAVDLNSYLRGLTKTAELPEVQVEFQGDAHNALFDVLFQISLLFKGVEDHA